MSKKEKEIKKEKKKKKNEIEEENEKEKKARAKKEKKDKKKKEKDDKDDKSKRKKKKNDKNPIIPSGIKQGCKKGDYPRVCEATMLSLMKNNDKIDASTIYYSSTQALEQALNVAKMSVLDQELGIDAKVSSLCEQVYIEALHALKDALKATVEKDRYMVLLKLSAVVTNIETCQDCITKDNNSKLEQVNTVLWRLSANAISLGAEAMPLNPHNK
ncbi:hypothetical protein V2J09_022165 [Rumex salicifolius]